MYISFDFWTILRRQKNVSKFMNNFFSNHETWIFSVCAPVRYAPQIHRTCHYTVHHYVNKRHVRRETQIICSYKAGGAQTEDPKILGIFDICDIPVLRPIILFIF